MIRFVVKAAFWGFVGLLILPSLVAHDAPATGTETAVDGAATSFHGWRMAGSLAAELGAVCEHQPAICRSGQMLAQAAIARAREGLTIAAHMVTGGPASGDEAATAADPNHQLGN